MQAAKVPHPGSILKNKFLKPNEISPYRLSKDTKIPQSRLSQILKGKRGITADTALRLSAYFGTSALYFLQLQNDYELSQERNINAILYRSIQNNSTIHFPELTENFVIEVEDSYKYNRLKLCITNESQITQRNYTVFHINDGQLVDVTQENDPEARYGPADATCNKEVLLEQFNNIIHSSILITE